MYCTAAVWPTHLPEGLERLALGNIYIQEPKHAGLHLKLTVLVGPRKQ
jgi:hypothetical protein